jgi:hypothetical protein
VELKPIPTSKQNPYQPLSSKLAMLRQDQVLLYDVETLFTSSWAGRSLITFSLLLHLTQSPPNKNANTMQTSLGLPEYASMGVASI